MRFRSIAQTLRELGLWCFPVAGKRPLVLWKSLQEAPPDEAQSEYWANRWPWAGGGVPTGAATNLLVVDADSAEAIVWLEHKGMPATWQVQTWRGRQYWYNYPAGIEAHNEAGKLAENVDLRGCGGYAVSPGSTCWKLSDRTWIPFTYIWAIGRCSPSDLPRANPPTWLLDHLREKAQRQAATPICEAQPYSGVVSNYARKAFDGLINDLIDAKNGCRNQTLLETANRFGSLIAGGQLDEADVLKSVMCVVRGWEKDEPIAKSRNTLIRGIEHGKLRPSGRTAL
jgi:hypothetical protein